MLAEMRSLLVRSLAATHVLRPIISMVSIRRFNELTLIFWYRLIHA